MPFPGTIGRGGGSGAYGLGPAPNTFADATARDAQATGDAAWLAQYNANRFFWIRTGSDIQRRNAAGNGWENVTAVVQGPRGLQGIQGATGTGLLFPANDGTWPNATQANERNLLLVPNDDVYQVHNEVESETPPTVAWGTTLPTGVLGAYTFDGRPSANAGNSGQRIYLTDRERWQHSVRYDPSAFTDAYYAWAYTSAPAGWVGDWPTEAQANDHATAVGDLAYWGDALRVVTSYAAGVVHRRYFWVPLGTVSDEDIPTEATPQDVAARTGDGYVPARLLPADSGGATDLSVGARDADSLEVQSSTGANAAIPSASETEAGLASAADKTQLGDLPPTWAAGVHAVASQVAWSGRVYRCLVARVATDTDTPQTDATGWAPVGTGGGGGGGDPADGVASSIGLALAGTTVTVTVERTVGADLTGTVDLASLEEWRGAWSGLAGQTLRVGDLIEHTSRYYIVRQEHTRTSSGPDTDSTNFALINSWGGTYGANTFYHAGSLVVYASGIWINNADVLDTDPNPDDAANTKWHNLTAFTAADRTKLDGVETGATADQTASEIVDLIEGETGEDRLDASNLRNFPAATETQAGDIEIANNTETDGGTDNTVAITPVKLRRGTGALITTTERTATTPAATVRRFTPADIVAMITEHGGGLTVAEVNARITALVEAWARDATTEIPIGKLPTTLVTETELNTAIANFQTAVQVQAAITAALGNLDLDEYLDYQGAWAQSTAYALNDVVQHAGATYLCTQAAGVGTQATTEPGAGAQWRNFWDRLGYEDGPPNAFTGASRLDRTITFEREGGGTQELTLPAGGETAYSYYQEYAEDTTPAFNLTAVTAVVPVLATEDFVRTLLDTSIPTGIDLAKPLDVDFQGNLLFLSPTNREVEISVGHRFFAGAPEQLTLWRDYRFEAQQTREIGISMDVFSITETLAAGSYTRDDGGTLNLTQALFNDPVAFQVLLRVRLYDRTSGSPHVPFDVRINSNISHLSLSQGGLIVAQLGAFEQSGTGSSRGDKLFTSNELPTARGSHGAAIAGLTWTRNEAPAAWEIDGTTPSIILAPDLPHDEAVIGTWAVVQDISDSANPVDTGSAFLGWGNTDYSADTIRVADDEYIGLVSRTDQTSGAVTFQFRWNNPDGESAGAANRRIVLYEAVAGQEGAPGEDGTTEFEPDDLGTHTFALDGSATEVALTDASNTAILCPDNGWILATINVPTLGIIGQIVWVLAEDLRAADQDASITAGLYTNASNQIFFHAGVQQMASTGNEILIQHLGDTRDSTDGAESAVLPSIIRFDIEGTQFPVPGSLSGQSYTYDIAIGQPGHAASARIVGFAGARGTSPPASVAVLRNLTTLASETGTITLPNVTLADGEHYTIELQVYPTGRTPGDGQGVSIYSDYQVTARAVTSQVHFGLFQYSSGDTIQDVINGIAFADDDISQANQAAGSYTFAGFTGDNEYVPYWAVPSSLTQPTSFTQNGFPVGAIVIANAITRTISGVEYTIYHYELADRVDSFADGVVTVVS